MTKNYTMDRIKSLFQTKTSYEPVDSADRHHAYDDDTPTISDDGDIHHPFSWIEYSVFLLLGIAMLWAWNMFLAAVPYFRRRFAHDPWIFDHFQPAEVSVATMTNMISMFILSRLQQNASYPKRIIGALLISTVAFTLLAISTLFKTSPYAYFGFLLMIVFVSSLGTGLVQNGVFAYVSGFGQSQYTQAIMTGQAVAGVLPPLVQIISTASVPTKNPDTVGGETESPKAAFIYFSTAVGVSLLSLVAFIYLQRRRPVMEYVQKTLSRRASAVEGLVRQITLEDIPKPTVSLTKLLRELPSLSAAVVLCFAITMIFPVFTASILSTSGIDTAIFIPLAFLMWNSGDLLGRLVTVFPRLSLTHYPFALLCLALARLLFIPLYMMCNIEGRGAIISSDLFYLVVVQFLFGLTNGYLGSQCMMGAGEWVHPDEREAAGGFMAFMLTLGLTIGSLLSFTIGGV